MPDDNTHLAMEKGRTRLRLRAVASSWFTGLVVVCAVLAVAGGAVAYTAHAAPGTTTHQADRTLWSVDGEFSHAAEVTRENPVFEVGETLSNRSTYFATAAPVLDARYAATYRGSADAANVSVDATLVTRASGENTVYWTQRRPLEEGEAGLSSGESAAIEVSVNASAMAARLVQIQRDLGTTPGDVTSEIVVAVDAESATDEGPSSLSFTHRLPVSIAGNTYAVGPAEGGREAVTATETVTRQRDRGPLWSVGGPLVFLAGAGGLAGLVVGRRRDAFAVSPAERRFLAFREERAEFDEWVTAVRLPAEVRERPRAEADSVADLVDFAIDTDAGVVEDPDTGTLYAVGEDLLVAYEPPPDPTAGSTDPIPEDEAGDDEADAS